MRAKSEAPRRVGRRAVLATAASALAFPAIRAQAQAAGVALVIGNSKYHWEASLPNVKRDAPDIAKRFQAFGLRTELVQDAGRDAMRRAIDGFIAAGRGASFGALYFAGHGAAWAKDTYLVPVDADLSDPSTVKNLILIKPLREGTDGAVHRLLVFDNCRNNPADGWRQKEVADYSGTHSGVVSTSAPNILALYSTAPGRFAIDGPPGENSPFAAALMRQFDSGSVELQGLPARLRRDLLIATEGRQVLFDQNAYQQPFVLRGTPGRAAANRSGWASDPSRIVELPNAYAFAQQNGLLVPPGLVAHRPPPGSRDATKVGSYRFTDSYGGPALAIIMSVEEQASAEMIMALRERSTGNNGWRFFRGSLSNNVIQYLPSTRAAPSQMSWSDANSGLMTSIVSTGSGGATKTPKSSPFTRLDG
jgi:hypothetical protein